MTRIVVMSDTHMLHRRLQAPAGDIVVHCGDWTAEGTLNDYDDFFAWFGGLPHKHKVLTAGNHENVMEQFRSIVQRRMPGSIMYLEDESAVVEGLLFWGSPRTPGDDGMAFTHRASEHPERIWAKIPDYVDVLITHGPPYGILDRNINGQRIGDKSLTARVEEVRPKLHLFGHVHDHNASMERFGTTFVNAAIGDDDAHPNHSSRIWIVDVDGNEVHPWRNRRGSNEDATVADS